MEGYVLEKQAATNQEYDWIVTALKGMASAYASKNLEQTLAKLDSLKKREENRISVDFSVAREDEKINGQLKLLEEAIEKGHIVQFVYTNSHDEMREMQVEPVQLQYKWYNWYLIGYYEKYQDYCMFKLVRMDALKMTERKNTKVHNLSEISKMEDKSPIVNVRLRGKANLKSKCREYLNGQITKEFENGDFEFCFSVPEHEIFWFGVILSFGNQVKILEPRKIRERILQTCMEIQMVYKEETENEGI